MLTVSKSNKCANGILCCFLQIPVYPGALRKAFIQASYDAMRQKVNKPLKAQ